MQGLITISSKYPVKETIDRFVDIAESRGLTVFSRIDYMENALPFGVVLRPTELIIFGNPKTGSPLMLDKQTVGIDLPMKALAWQDDSGAVWLTYNDPEWIKERHGLSGKETASIIKAIEEGMNLATRAAAQGLEMDKAI
jgi:uncharacterized protein (DUF302 family)